MSARKFTKRDVLALLLSATASIASHAETSMPDGPIRIVVPYTPGTGIDLMARTVGVKLGERIGRPVYIDNRTGASGSIGAAFVAKAPPNGSTIMFNASTLVTSATLYPTLPYDPVKDFTPIALTGWTRLVLVTHPKTGIKNIRELVDAARKSLRSVSFGTPGAGTPNHLTAELFSEKAGITMMHVPYRGSAQQITDILAGQVDMAPLSLMAAAPHVKDGKLVALALTGDRKSNLLPGVPTLSEVGIPGVDGDIWYGVFGPPGMPADLVERLSAEIKTIVQSQDMRQALADKGFDAEYESAAEFRQRASRDATRWATLIRERGIKPE